MDTSFLFQNCYTGTDFENLMQIKWRYFLKTLGDPEIPFKTVITGLQYFLEPVWRCFLAEEEFLMSWQSINAVWKKGDVSKRKMAR